ncbi:PAS domain S-box protein [Sphingomonas sp.]|uniref:PAS domain S-box protein n=1 Tax=Sphingomonas sp. TaxID=28214 RepID=UPI0035BC50FC
MTVTDQPTPTDARRAEELARFRMLFAQAPSFAAVLVGPEHRFLLANPAYQRLVGGRPVLGLTVAEALPETTGQDVVARLDQVFASGEAFVGSAVPIGLVPPGGGPAEERRLDFVYQPIRDDDGAVIAIFVEGTDVTERHAATEALRASEARHRQILDSAIDYAIIATDLAGHVTRWNVGAERTLGWSEAEMLGMPVDRIFTPEDCTAGQPTREMNEALATGHGRDERWHLRRSSERFWANGEMTPIRDDDGTVIGFVKVLRDRTEEHRAAEALQASEARLRRAQEAGGVGVFAITAADNTLEASPEFCRIFGLPDAATYPGDMVEALVLPEDTAAISTVETRTRGGIALDAEYRIRRANDGAIRTIARRAEFEHDAAGNPIRLVGVVQDVTDQRIAQAAIQASEQRFRAFTEAVPNQVWSATPDGRVDWANQRTYEYGGYDEARLLQDGWKRRLHPDDLAHAAAVWQAALADGTPYEVEFRLRRADGAFRWHLARAMPLHDEGGAIVRWIGTNTDIDDERAARRQLAELNATLEDRVEQRTRERDRAWANSQDLQAVVDPDGRLRAANGAWATILGYAPADVIGRVHLDLVHPDDRGASARALGTDAGNTLPAYENRMRHADGSWRWVSWVAAPDEGLVYASGRHVTAEKAAAAALEAAQDQLRQAQKMEAVGQLTGGVAHDFNNLLTVIRGSVDLLRRDDLTPDRRARYIDAIRDTADRAAKLTGQLLAFARRQTLNPALFDARDSLREVAGMVETLAGARVSVDILLPADPCSILADRSQFDTAVVNMAINARDAMHGEGTLTIEAAPVDRIPQTRAHPAVSGDFVAVSIRDTGEGIAADVVDRIFEPFFTTKALGEGTGLGLSQVIGFAKQSGGDIRVESVAGSGTTFTLYLPRAPGLAADPAANASPATETAGDGVCVLVVEDNAQVGEFATEALKELGCHSTLTVDGPDALAELAENRHLYQIVFSDVMMPGMTGLELGAEIRQRYPDLPVVLTSGYCDVLARQGTHGFELLQKPYSIEQLSRVLRKTAAAAP